MPTGNYVTDKTIAKVEDQIRSGEEVKFLARGNKVYESYQGSKDSIDYVKGKPRLAVTDSRLFIKIPKIMNSKILSYDFSEIGGMDIGDSGMTGTVVNFRTSGGKDYTFRADKPEEVELKQLAEYVRSQLSQTDATPNQNTNSQNNQSDMSTPTAQNADSRKTASCVECGAAVGEHASQCPNCGYDGPEHMKWLIIHLVLAIVTIPTLVGPVIFGWKVGTHFKKLGTPISEE